MARQAAVGKKAPPRATPTKKMAEGEIYVCGECGLMVQVVEPCACEPEVCYATCCEQPMGKAAGTRAARKTKRAKK